MAVRKLKPNCFNVKTVFCNPFMSQILCLTSCFCHDSWGETSQLRYKGASETGPLLWLCLVATSLRKTWRAIQVHWNEQKLALAFQDTLSMSMTLLQFFLFKKNTKYLILQHFGSMAITLICSSIGQGIKECQPEIAWEVDWLGSRGKSLLENTTLPWDNPPAALRLDYSGRMPVLLRNRWQHSKMSKRETRRNVKRKKIPTCCALPWWLVPKLPTRGSEWQRVWSIWCPTKNQDLCARVTSSK